MKNPKNRLIENFKSQKLEINSLERVGGKLLSFKVGEPVYVVQNQQTNGYVDLDCGTYNFYSSFDGITV